MQTFFNITTCIIFEIAGLLFNVANAFLADIAMYEVTNGLSFNWSRLLVNRVFWIIIALQIMHAAVTFCVHRKNAKSDQRLEKAIETGQIKLVRQVVSYTKKGDFNSANEVITVLDKLGERRSK